MMQWRIWNIHSTRSGWPFGNSIFTTFLRKSFALSYLFSFLTLSNATAYLFLLHRSSHTAGSQFSTKLPHSTVKAYVRFQVEVVQYGAAQEQFNISHAINFWTPTPPLSEQDEIAAFLDRETAKLDELAAEAASAVDLLQERRTALISAAVTGKIDVRALAQTITA